MSKNFPKVLKYCRSLARRSQLELALDAGVSARHLSFLESGRAEPGRDVVVKLAVALDVSDTARNALFAAAGFLPAPGVASGNPGRILRLERMLQNWDPHPSLLADSRGCVLATNAGMRALHAALTGVEINLQGISAAELAVGDTGFGPYLKNREALQRRFAHCRALEKLVSGGSVAEPRADADGPTPTEMLLESEFGVLSFELVEAIEGHRFHDQEHAVRIYGMMPSDRKTDAAVSTMTARYKPAIAAPSDARAADLRR
jgi:transcriptional regulator with XRE-family HTH domain